MIKSKSMEEKSGKAVKVYEIFLFGAVLLITGLIVYTNLFHYCYKMNADIASEAVLARHTWESGEWIPKSWCHGTEVRIFFAANLAALFYGICNDMSLAMGSACCVMTFCILGSLYFFISQFSFHREEKLLFILLCLLMPNHFIMLELFYLFASYYAVHIILLFLAMGIYVRMLGGAHVRVVWQVLLILFSFGIGMQGVRGILVINAPMLVTEMLRQLYLLYEKKWEKKNVLTAGWCMFMLFAGWLGTLTPYSIGQQISRNIRKGPAKLWETVLPQFFEAMGWTEIDGSVRVVYLFLLLISLGVLVSYLFQFLKTVCAGEDKPLIWAYLLMWISLGATMAAVAFTTIASSRRYYFVILPIMAFGFVCFTHSFQEKKHYLRIAGCAVALFLLFFQVREIYFPILQSEEPAPSTEYEVCKYLKENNYEIAYANFEKANVITVLSGGAVRGAAVASMERMDMCKWLNSTDWYVPNMPYHSRTAYVVSETDKEAFERFRALHTEEIRLEKKIGYLYIYSSDYNLSCLY